MDVCVSSLEYCAERRRIRIKTMFHRDFWSWGAIFALITPIHAGLAIVFSYLLLGHPCDTMFLSGWAVTTVANATPILVYTLWKSAENEQDARWFGKAVAVLSILTALFTLVATWVYIDDFDGGEGNDILMKLIFLLPVSASLALTRGVLVICGGDYQTIPPAPQITLAEWRQKLAFSDYKIQAWRNAIFANTCAFLGALCCVGVQLAARIQQQERKEQYEIWEPLRYFGLGVAYSAFVVAAAMSTVYFPIIPKQHVTALFGPLDITGCYVTSFGVIFFQIMAFLDVADHDIYIVFWPTMAILVAFLLYWIALMVMCSSYCKWRVLPPLEATAAKEEEVKEEEEEKKAVAVEVGPPQPLCLNNGNDDDGDTMI